jgi:hypothetical protein
MTNYKCDGCNRGFKGKANLQQHIDKGICANKNYNCAYCDNKFTSKNSMYRHTREFCKVKKAEDTKRDKIYECLIKVETSRKEIKLLKRENGRLQNEVKLIKKTNIVMPNNVNNVNVNNGIVNHITLVAYGNEDLTKIDRAELLQILRKGYDSTLRLTEVVHFNPKYPEYHNVYITNMKDKYAMMYDGANWALTMKDELINKIYDDNKNYIEENLEDFIESLRPSQKRALDRWVNTDEKDRKIRAIKERIKLLLYNNKHLPIETQTLVEKQ